MDAPDDEPEAVGASGNVEHSGEQPTCQVYPERTWGTSAESVAAREREAEAITAEVEAIKDRLKVLMLVEDETGIRAGRSYDCLTSDPFVSDELWTVAKAVGWLFVASVVSGNPDLRRRASVIVRDALGLVAEAHELRAA